MQPRHERIAVPLLAQHPQSLAEIVRAKIVETGQRGGGAEDRLLAEVALRRLAPRERGALVIAQLRPCKVVDMDRPPHGLPSRSVPATGRPLAASAAAMIAALSSIISRRGMRRIL